MKFTSEDLLKAMGLKVGNIIFVGEPVFNDFLVENCKGNYYLQGLYNDKVLKLGELLNYEYEIIQPKPILTEDEKVILRNLPKYIINIYRDGAQNLFVGSNDGSYTRIYYQHMFDFIKVGDGCYSIEELLKE